MSKDTVCLMNNITEDGVSRDKSQFYFASEDMNKMQISTLLLYSSEYSSTFPFTVPHFLRNQ